jgi:hypothetical protein
MEVSIVTSEVPDAAGCTTPFTRARYFQAQMLGFGNLPVPTDEMLGCRFV